MHKILCTATTLLLLASCTIIPARTKDGDPNPPDIATSIDRLSTDEAHRGEVAKATFEYHNADGFMAGFVEFDDQGWFFNHEQFETVQHQIEEALQVTTNPQPAIIVSFIHGWRHTVSVCDRDTVCFREVLRGLAVYEKERARLCAEAKPGDPACAQRKVVGVMTGWRGAPIGQQAGFIENLNVFSFYSRKRTAHLIGQSGYISSLVGWLNQLDGRPG